MFKVKQKSLESASGGFVVGGRRAGAGGGVGKERGPLAGLGEMLETTCMERVREG